MEAKMEEVSEYGNMAPEDHDDSFGFVCKTNESTCQQQKELLQNETKTVRRYKCLFVSVLSISMIGIATTVYILASRAEQAIFKTDFRDSALKILDSVGGSLDQTIGALDVFSVGLISSARSDNMTWPFVTIDDFGLKAAKIRTLSKAAFINIYPYVLHKNRDAWEEYTATHNSWVDDGVAITSTDMNYYGRAGNDGENYTVWDIIHGNDEYGFDEGIAGTVGVANSSYYYPIWQQYPVSPFEFPPYNWDLASESSNEVIAKELDVMLRTKLTMLSAAYLLPDLDDPEDVSDNQYEAEWLETFIHPDEDSTEPAVDIFYPLFDTLHSVSISSEQRDATFVGWISITFYWREQIRNILPEGQSSVIVVFENPCNPTFTYQLDGGNATFLGRGDLHNSKFDGMEIETLVIKLGDFATRERTFSGTPFQTEVCQYTLHLFPSNTMEGNYISRNPLVLTVSTLAIFISTALFFVLYDWVVERRQRKLFKTATLTNNIVTSLFPTIIRRRMLDDIESDMRTDKDTPVNGFERSDKKNGETANESNQPASTRPIADLFKETSIFFGDIAGFTKWSSQRDPGDVFALLEAIYGSFDEAARQRGVFKIETIGDCYVAVTGVPNPKKNHATIMIRFATDCRTRIAMITEDLSQTLGQDTTSLKLRIGIHSGSVMGGVLRGEKSRFQLFGDTMNTAARMESNGSPNRIHVSESTAQKLRENGKASWLVPREDKIHAKGKGVMVTYWVEPGMFGANSSHGSASSADDNGLGIDI